MKDWFGNCTSELASAPFKCEILTNYQSNQKQSQAASLNAASNTKSTSWLLH